MTTLIRDDLPAPAAERQTISAEKIRSLYDEGTRAIRHDQLQYQENACYIEGEQWVYRHSTRQEILSLPRDPRKVRATIPRLGPESRRIFSKLLRRPLVFEVTPDAPDDETIRGAQIAEAVISDLARRQKWENIREEFAWAGWKGGTAALCLDWDSSAGRYLGETMSGRQMGQGDIKVSALAITEIATEPGTRDIERACWWIKAQAIPPSEAKKLYKLSKLPAASASPALTPMQAKYSAGNNGQQPLNLTLVLTYYERPNADNRKGMVATVIGEEVVDGPHDWPFPFVDRLNLTCLRETMIEGRWTGRTVVSDAVPIQTALNHSWTSVLEHLKSCSNARVQGNSAEQHNAENWTDEPGEFIFWDATPFEWMSPTPMPEWWMRTPAELAMAMDDAIGVHDTSRGVAPRNIESGTGLAILVEQDDTPTGRYAQKLADCFGDLATMILQTYEVNVPAEERRIARLNVPGFATMQIGWNGQSFAGQTIATVPFEAVAPINEAARFARLQFFVQSGLITTPRQASKFLDIPGLSGSEFITSIDPQVKKARDENYLLAQGEAEIPATFDNHAIHIEEHNAYRSSGAYRRLEPGPRRLVDMHVQAHSTLAAEETANQMLKAQFAPGLAQAAQADQPPGSALPPSQPMGEPSILGAQMGGGDGQTPAPEPPTPGPVPPA